MIPKVTTFGETDYYNPKLDEEVAMNKKQLLELAGVVALWILAFEACPQV